MALATINGARVISGSVTLPRTGRWVGNFTVDAASTDGLDGKITIQLGSQLQLVGTVKRCGVFIDKVTLQAVGGAAGLLKQLEPKAYQGVPLQVPLADALAEVGESLSATSDPSVTGVELPKWNRMRAELAEEIRGLLLAAPAGATGRILPDGTFWVGVETWPDQDIGEYNLIEDHHAEGSVTLGVEEPALLPGVTFLERKVQEVTHKVDGDRVRTLVQFLQDPTGNVEPDPTTPARDLDLVVQKQLKRARYMRTCPAKVVQQNGDLSLELELDSQDFPGLSNVPLRTFAPGAVLKVEPGSRVGVTFEDGDPQKPVAVLWEQGAGGMDEWELHAAAKASLVAPAVALGSLAATEPLVLGSSNQTLEASFDTAVETAVATLTAAITAATSAPGWPTPAQLAALWTGALSTFVNVISTAAAARSSGRAATLSAVSKTT